MPTPQEIQEVIDAAISSEMFTTDYADVFAGDERWRSLPTPTGNTFEWYPESTYVRKPPYFEGMEATLLLLNRAFEKSGLSVVDPVGQPFNPEFHEAIATQPTAEQAPGTVLAVVQKGYLLNGRLLRPARVLVAREPDPPAN